MAAWVADADIIFLSYAFFYLLLSFFLSSPNLRSETCSTRLAENTGRKKSPNIRYLRTIAQLCRAISSQVRHISIIGKMLLNSNISRTSPYNMVNFGPLAAEICWRVWGTPANLTGFASWQRYCTAL